MTIFEMLEQSGILTLLGVGIVFSFLAVLVFAISLTGKIINRFVKDAPVQGSYGGASNQGAVTAAITAAVNEYRKTNK